MLFYESLTEAFSEALIRAIGTTLVVGMSALAVVCILILIFRRIER